MSETTFSKLAALDCKEHTEKKGGFTYLSWPWAVRKLRETAPNATWEVRRFDGLPYLSTDCGYFVEVAVTVDGITLSQIHPVLDGRNQPIKAPNAFHINTSIQRCLVKAIALHGLGLYIYAGEDLPNPEDAAEEPKPNQAYEKPNTPTQQNKDAFDELKPDVQTFLRDLAAKCEARFKAGEELHAWLELQNLEDVEKMGLWSLLDSKIRSAIKRQRQEYQLREMALRETENA